MLSQKSVGAELLAPQSKRFSDDVASGGTQAIVYILASFGCAKAPKKIAPRLVRIIPVWHGIALWDVVTECEIKGSEDASIRDYEVADVPAFANAHGIVRILVNGRRALDILLSAYPELADVAILLPSTSPANPRFDKSAWENALPPKR